MIAGEQSKISISVLTKAYCEYEIDKRVCERDDVFDNLIRSNLFLIVKCFSIFHNKLI